MSEYNSEQYKEWYENNKLRIRGDKTIAKKKYRRTEAGKAAQRKYNKKPSRRAYVKNRNFTKRYGITLAEYQEMIRIREGRCDICNKVDNLHVDHCHIVKKVRGLLCGNCNKALGLFKDDVIRISKAINYLNGI